MSGSDEIIDLMTSGVLVGLPPVKKAPVVAEGEL